MHEPDWLTRLYLQHKQLLLLVAWGIVRDRLLAEDVVHSAFLKMVSAPSPSDDPKVWAIRIVRNQAIDVVRQRSRNQIHIEQYSDQLDDSHSVELPMSEEAVNQERSQSIASALGQLDSLDQQIIQLHLQGELTFREIAESYQLPLATIASRYRRAIEKLKKSIEVHRE